MSDAPERRRSSPTETRERANRSIARGGYGSAPYSDTIHRWDWFRRSQWRPSFLDRMLKAGGASCRTVLKVIGDPAGKLVFDATCGLGRKTLVLSHLGVKVVGADASAYAVGKARELASGEGHSIEFFVSEWRCLPERVPHRFDAVFLDAFLDCCETYDDLAASFAGIAGVLKPGGAFIYFGLEPGEKLAEVLEGAWRASGPFSLAWHHAEGGCECTCLHANYRGPDFIDNHHLFIIKEGPANVRLETATVRRLFRHDRAALAAAARGAGFCGIRTHCFEGCTFDGAPLLRIIARK